MSKETSVLWWPSHIASSWTISGWPSPACLLTESSPPQLSLPPPCPSPVVYSSVPFLLPPLARPVPASQIGPCISRTPLVTQDQFKLHTLWRDLWWLYVSLDCKCLEDWQENPRIWWNSTWSWYLSEERGMNRGLVGKSMWGVPKDSQKHWRGGKHFAEGQRENINILFFISQIIQFANTLAWFQARFRNQIPHRR